MPRPKRLASKPGTQAHVFRPDNIISFTAAEGKPGTLLDFLFDAMPEARRTTVKDYLKHRQVMLGAYVTTRFDAPVAPGDEVRVNTTREFQVFSHPRMRLVYEDDDIIIVDKGYGLLSMGTDKIKDGTAYSILRDYLKRKDPRNKLFIVHRLDRDTSGLMMFAKNLQVQKALQSNWNSAITARTYVAVVEGRPEKDSDLIVSNLTENAKMQVYVTAEGDGKEAITRYRLLHSNGAYSLLELDLETGRKNQIRAQMQSIGHSIAGDYKYGAETDPTGRLMLHARRLFFIHPVTGEEMRFETRIPDKFTSLAK